MNGTGFGFPTYPQRPSIKPQQVGMALQRMNQPVQADMTAAPGAILAGRQRAALAGLHQRFSRDSATYAGSLASQPMTTASVIGGVLRGDPAARAVSNDVDQMAAVRRGDSTAIANAPAAGSVDEHAFGLSTPPRFSTPSRAPNGAPSQDPDPDPAIKMAVHEAMQRSASGGASPGQQGDGNPNNARQLARMGLSPLEIRLLGMSGGARF